MYIANISQILPESRASANTTIQKFSVRFTHISFHKILPRIKKPMSKQKWHEAKLNNQVRLFKTVEIGKGQSSIRTQQNFWDKCLENTGGY
jgi:hypothetical protein